MPRKNPTPGYTLHPIKDKTPLTTVDLETFKALLRYWYEMDIDSGSSKRGHVWDLRLGMAQRWPDWMEDWRKGDAPTPHIHYAFSFHPEPGVDYSMEDAVHNRDYPGSKILISHMRGTFPEEYNEEFDQWVDENIDQIAYMESEFGIPYAEKWVERHGPPRKIESPDNWSPGDALDELELILEEAKWH